MTGSEVRHKVRQFKKDAGLRTVSYASLKKAADALGYTVIHFNHVLNDRNVAELLDALDLTVQAASSKGFTYSDGDYRLIFIHEDLSAKEKTVVLSHELGHIRLGHLRTGDIIGNDVNEELDANEFVHYLLKPGVSGVFRDLFTYRKKAMIAVITALVLLAGGIATVSIINSQDKYYITETGFKYHKKDCVFVKGKNNVTCVSIDDIRQGNYTPCEMCLAAES